MTYTTNATRCFSHLGIALLAAIGCGESVPKQDAVVQGTVTIDGELVGQGVVTFHPESNGPVAYGTILDDGTYALRIGKGQKEDRDNKIFSGEYIATVAVTMPSTSSQGDQEDGSIRKPGPRLSDAKFSSKESSELKYTVASGRNIINISVERALPEEDGEEVIEGEAESQETAATEENQEGQVPSGEQSPESDATPAEQPKSEEAVTDSDVKEEVPAQ